MFQYLQNVYDSVFGRAPQSDLQANQAGPSQPSRKRRRGEDEERSDPEVLCPSRESLQQEILALRTDNAEMSEKLSNLGKQVLSFRQERKQMCRKVKEVENQILSSYRVREKLSQQISALNREREQREAEWKSTSDTLRREAAKAQCGHCEENQKVFNDYNSERTQQILQLKEENEKLSVALNESLGQRLLENAEYQQQLVARDEFIWALEVRQQDIGLLQAKTQWMEEQIISLVEWNGELKAKLKFSTFVPEAHPFPLSPRFTDSYPSPAPPSPPSPPAPPSPPSPPADPEL